jgi:hypothetical protein
VSLYITINKIPEKPFNSLKWFSFTILAKLKSKPTIEGKVIKEMRLG